MVIIPLQISSFKDPSANDRAGQIYSSLVERYGVGRAIAITWSKLREEGWNLAKEPPQAPTPPPAPPTPPQPKKPQAPTHPSLFSDDEIKYSFKASLLKSASPKIWPCKNDPKTPREWALRNYGPCSLVFSEDFVWDSNIDVYLDSRQGRYPKGVPEGDPEAIRQIMVKCGQERYLLDCKNKDAQNLVIHFLEDQECLKVLSQMVMNRAIEQIKTDPKYRNDVKRMHLERGTYANLPDEILIALGPAPVPPEEDV